jgi:hypothetical protein
MSTLTVTDIPLDTESPAQRLRRIAAAVRVSLHWWGVHRALTAQQKEEFGSVTSADARFLTAGKKLIDVRHEAFRKLTSIKTRIGYYWRGICLPYVENGVRLIRQSDIEGFVHTMEGFRDELTQAETDLAAVYDQVKADARHRLGRLYNPADYPPEIHDLFGRGDVRCGLDRGLTPPPLVCPTHSTLWKLRKEVPRDRVVPLPGPPIPAGTAPLPVGPGFA